MHVNEYFFGCKTEYGILECEHVERYASRRVKNQMLKPNLIVSHTICDTTQPLGGVTFMSKICKYVPLDGVWF